MKTAQERYRELQEKSKKIIEGAIQINTKIESAQEARQKLGATMQEKFETTDVEELDKMLNDWHAENEAKVDKYETDVISLEKEVSEKGLLIKQIQQSAA